MFKRTLLTGCSVLLALVFAMTGWSGNGSEMRDKRQYVATSGERLSALPYEDLSEEEISGLTYMREEEKLSRDVYAALGDVWGHWVFTRIVRSEQRHMEMVGQLLTKYGITDPVTDNTVGVFSDEGLQLLYDELVEAGSVSVAEAFRVGATIEDMDIDDLMDRLNQTNNVDIKTVYQNLMKGSRNHLRAFVYQLALQGGTYEAQFLSTEELAAITSAAPERGPVNENGEPANVRFRNGERFQDCVNIGDDAADSVDDGTLISRRGRGAGGSGGGQYGPGDGNGNGGNGPKDGTGNGRKSGDCVNQAIERLEMVLA